MKNLDELKVLRKKHYDRYSQSTQVGKLRAWGRLKKLATKRRVTESLSGPGTSSKGRVAWESEAEKTRKRKSQVS